jgi:hypothetical protein
MTKKQFFFAAVIISATIVSCSKEKSETPQPGTTVDNSITFKPISFDPLKIGLSGRFEFDGSLADLTGKLKDATSYIGKVTYTTDRKGTPDHAIEFDGNSGLQIFNVPLEENVSIAVWVQTKCYPEFGQLPFVEGQHSFSLSQFETNYQVAYWNDILGSNQYVDASSGREWHHLAATRDTVSLKFYIDGILVGSSPTPAGSVPSISTSEYILGFGYNGGYVYWNGSMDDLRFYKRVLTSSEVYKLAHL